MKRSNRSKLGERLYVIEVKKDELVELKSKWVVKLKNPRRHLKETESEYLIQIRKGADSQLMTRVEGV
jgi:hypothetical protein